MSAELHAKFQASGFSMDRAFAEVPVEDMALDWGCWPLVEEDEVVGHLCVNGTIEACSRAGKSATQYGIIK